MPVSPFENLSFILSQDNSWDSMRTKLAGHRKCMGWTQQEIARRMGISQSQLSDLETGRTADPRASTVQRWARALEFEPTFDLVPDK